MEVRVNVYYLLNNEGQPIKIPLFCPYHSGIEVCGVEYSFGGGPVQGTGVWEQPPRQSPPNALFKESIVLGRCSKTRSEVESIVDHLKAQFPASSYSPVTNNCNHFSNRLSTELLNKPIPSWINRAAGIGGFLGKIGCFPSLLGPNTPQSTSVAPVDPFSQPGFSLSQGSTASASVSTSTASSSGKRKPPAATPAPQKELTPQEIRELRLAALQRKTASPGGPPLEQKDPKPN